MDKQELLELIEKAAVEKWTELDLRGKRLTELPPQIGDLINLTTIDLSYNRLETLPTQMEQLVNLRSIDVSWNPLQLEDTVNSFPKESLRNWILDRTQLVAALEDEFGPETISQQLQIIEANIQKNQASSFPIPEQIQELDPFIVWLRIDRLLTAPIYLDLSYNKLTAVPPQIGQLSSLTLLNLSDNKLTVVPPEIGQLSSLTTLDLSSNQLTAVPLQIGQLASLMWLDLSSNQLTAVPPEIVQLSNLTTLYLSGNKLTAVPPEILQLSSLTSLSLSRNRLTAVPLEITQLSSLTKLNLRSNQLTAVPPEIVQLSNLTELDLSGNKLTAVPPEILQLASLTSLNLSDNQLTAVPPQIGQLSSLTKLDLSDNQLTFAPETLIQLTNLQTLDLANNKIPFPLYKILEAKYTRAKSLDLSNNKLTAVPPEIGQLSNLTKLYLDDNQLTAVPPQIGQLSNLTMLSLSSNQLTAVPPEIGQLSSLMELNLNINQLTAVPPEIVQLSSLTELYLRSNELTAVPPQIGQLSSLTGLYLSDNKLTAVLPEIGQLSSLTTLDLSSNELTAVPPQIGQLSSLMWLDLSSNELTAVPPEIGQLSNLATLYLSFNQLTAVPPQIGQLSNLTELVLSVNPLTAVPPQIGQLASLTELDLSGNRLTAVPPQIGQLSSLMELHLSFNQLTTVPPQIGQLSNLTKLSLSPNQLTAVPPQIGQLSSLMELHLSGNRLTAVPPQIGQLTNLEILNLGNDYGGNEITDLPVEIGQLGKLKRLKVRDNQLQRLPASLQQLTLLVELDLQGNPALGISPEVLAQTGNPALILQTYFSARLRSLHEAKMLLVGEGGVGKTALARRLIHNLPPDETQGKTEGLDILKYQITQSPIPNLQSPVSNPQSPITFNLWDFGGQGVYQATHQFFFTARSLYLVVVNARTGEHESRLRHWLNLVASLSDNAPVIIVVNKQDEHPFQPDEYTLKAKYRNLLAVVPTSCVSGEGIPELKEAIAAAVSHLPHVNDQFPLQWLDLKAELEKMGSAYISYEQYADRCRAHGITGRDNQRSWGRVLHQLGVILNYEDNDYRQLESTHVLNPEWVTDGVYRILSDPDGEIAKNHGILTPAMLDRILDPDAYPRHQHPFIVGMMQKFELSYPLPNRPHQHLIPDLLPQNQPEAVQRFEQDAPLHFQIHYTTFLPASVISRFMVGMMASLDWRSSWRSGAFLEFDQNRALVRADLEGRKLYISIAGPEATRRSLLNAIRMQLHAIHATYPNLPLSEEIPLPGHPGHTVAYQALLNHEKRGRATYYDGQLDAEFEVKKLLAGIETPEQRREWRIYEQLLGYNLEELRKLCFKLGVDYDEIPKTTTKSGFAREFVLYVGRNGRLPELEAALRR